MGMEVAYRVLMGLEKFLFFSEEFWEEGKGGFFFRSVKDGGRMEWGRNRGGKCEDWLYDFSRLGFE